MWLHGPLQILICQSCQVGLTSDTALGHLRSKHNRKVRDSEKILFEELCKSRNVHEKPQEVVMPKPGGPPVPGIAPPVEGFSCAADSECNYSVQDYQTMLKHCRVKHQQGLAGNSLHRRSWVQFLFAGFGKLYFEVDPDVAAASDLDVRQYLRGTFLPAQVDDPLVPQGSDRDRPPLLKITMWDEFEPEVREDLAQRQAAQQIKGSHAESELGGMFTSLGNAVKRYHELTKSLLEESAHSFTISKVLMNGPVFSPDQ